MGRKRLPLVFLSRDLGLDLGCPDASGTDAANHQDQLCQYGGFTYGYNLRGQLESRSDGSITTSYTYDGLGRLTQVSEPGMDIHYVHDALGRRIGKIRDGTTEKGWLYADALNPLAELDSAGNVRATFIYGTRAHVPDAMVMTDGTVYRFITDHLGSVRLVVNAETGAVVQRMDYDAFGRVLQDTAPGFQPFGFAGGLYDEDTGLVRFGARDYDAYAGRWTAKDPILFDGGDENLYSYAYNDPTNLIDPEGEIANLAVGAAVGAGLDLAFQLYLSGGDFACVDWAQVAIAGATGAIGVGLLSKFKVGSRLFGNLFGKGGLLNRGQHFRVGLGREGGTSTFRIAGDALNRLPSPLKKLLRVKNTPKGPKIDLRNRGPL